MTRYNNSFKINRRILTGLSGKLGDISIGVLVIGISAMMIMPLTPAVIDFLITLNIGFSALLLCLALFMTQPLSFTAFPTLLLIATLYRLALNISSTRLILLKADAGQIIRAFGGYIVGGDILVGAVIFGIISMVLFLVITKGAERVAEVAARFSLDALPGMQLAIESDFRCGAVSSSEAARRRASLDETSRYYGALDGAMKFVRGDAIASLVIVAVNIVGGIAVGMIRGNMTIGSALNTYGRLTVGDGLVSMIPALLVSTAAGLIVTRVGPSNCGIHLGQEINRQLKKEPRALAAAAALLFLLGIIPGLPVWPFWIFGGILGGVAVYRFKVENTNGISISTEEDGPSQTGRSACVAIEIKKDLYHTWEKNNNRQQVVNDIIGHIRSFLVNEIGLINPRVLVAETEQDIKPKVLLKLKNYIKIPFLHFQENVSIDEIIDSVKSEILRNVSQLIDVDQVQQHLDEITKIRPATVRESVPKIVSLPKLTELAGRLAEEKIFLTVLPEVLEIVGRTPTTLSLTDLLERVREGLSLLITNTVQDDTGKIKAFVLDPNTEAVLESVLISSGNESKLVLSDDDLSSIFESVRSLDTERPFVLLTSPHLRAPLAKILACEFENITVLKSAELSPYAKVHISGVVSV